MAEIRAWGVAGSGALMVSGADTSLAKPINYPIIDHDGVSIRIYEGGYENNDPVCEEPFGDWKVEVGTTAGATMKLVIEYLLAQKGL